MLFKFAHEVTVTIKLDPCAQYRLDRLLDLLELAVSKDSMTPDEIKDVVRQIRAEADSLRAAGKSPSPVHPVSHTQ